MPAHPKALNSLPQPLTIDRCHANLIATSTSAPSADPPAATATPANHTLHLCPLEKQSFALIGPQRNLHIGQKEADSLRGLPLRVWLSKGLVITFASARHRIRQVVRPIPLHTSQKTYINQQLAKTLVL